MSYLLIQHSSKILMAGLFTLVLTLIIRPLVTKIGLLDKPNVRKSHDRNTPLAGGICIFLSSALALLIFNDSWDQDFRNLFLAASSFLVLGALDDHFDFKAKVKLLAQVIISFVFVVSSGLEVSSIGNFFGYGRSFELGFLSIPFTLFAIVGLTNAFNMIDGCDGLATSLVALAILALSYFGSNHFGYSINLFLLVLLANLSVFLFFNFSNNPKLKVFLGDGGSLFLGFTVAVLLVKFADGNQTHNPTMVLWFVAVPVYDLLAVVLRRLSLQRKIMIADKSHLHHWFLSIGLSHLQTTMIIHVMAVALLCLGVLIETSYPSLSLFAFVGLFAVFLSIRSFGTKN